MIILNTCVYDSFVGLFQQYPAHGIHGVGLLEMDPEERSVELVDMIDFSCTLRNFGMGQFPTTVVVGDEIHLNEAFDNLYFFPIETLGDTKWRRVTECLPY